jgi:hypothetical protein
MFIQAFETKRLHRLDVSGLAVHGQGVEHISSAGYFITKPMFLPCFANGFSAETFSRGAARLE